MNDTAEKFDPQFRQEFFFWCCAVVSLLALLNRHALFWLEPRIAEAAREIVVTGRWYPFTVNFEPCSDLPPLEVWSVALIFKLGISEFSARLPSVLAAFALLIGTFRLAEMLFDRRTALLTSWLTLGSFGFLYMGRCCVPGMFPAAIAVWAPVLYLRGAGRRDFRFVPAAGALLMLGVLDAGPGFVPAAAALLVPWVFADRRRFDWRVAAATAGAAAVLWIVWAALLSDPLIPALKGLWSPASAKRWCSVWGRLKGNPALNGIRDAVLVILPWILVTATALGGAVYRRHQLSGKERCLLAGAAFGFLALVISGRAQRQDFLPLVPFLALETGVCVLRGSGGRLTCRAVVVTRSTIIALASFGVVSPVTVPLWRRVLNLELAMTFWIACFLFGAAVLLIMMLDCHPTRPLPRLAGLPEPLASTILGGTLTSICLLSFLLPSVRDVRVEKAFLLNVRRVIEAGGGQNAASGAGPREDGNGPEGGKTEVPAGKFGAKPSAFINLGRPDFTEMMLFYVRLPERVATISTRDGNGGREEFVRELGRHAGRRVAVFARLRKRDKQFLHRCAALAKAPVDVERPDCEEEIKYIYSELRAKDEEDSPAPGVRFLKHGFWIVDVPESAAAVKDKSTNVQDKGK